MERQNAWRAEHDRSGRHRRIKSRRNEQAKQSPRQYLTPFPCNLSPHPLPAARTPHHHTTHMSLGIAHPFVVGVVEIERVVAMCRDQRCQSEEGDSPAHGAVRGSWLGMEDGVNDER